MSPPDEDDAPDGPQTDRPMTLGEHLDELRRRVFRCVVYALIATGVVMCFDKELFGYVLAPYVEVLAKVPGASLQTTEVSEGFFVLMKFDIVMGIFFASPGILLEIWGFVARGLYDRERRVVHLVAPISVLLFLCGTVFYYFVIQPSTLDILLTVSSEFPLPGGGTLIVRPSPRLADALSFYLTMSLVIGLTFELPLVMVAAQKLGFVTWRTYSKYRKHFFMASLVLMAVLTPTGDAFTLVVCMVPVLFLFEGGIVACWIMQPNVPKEADEENS